MSKPNANYKHIVDAVMIVLLLCLMAYQVTGEKAHEWIGIGMTVLAFLHQVLNRKWFCTLFKGKYPPYRVAAAILNLLLVGSLTMTAFSGMSMSSYAVPFLYGMAPVSFVRRAHLSMLHWTFILMGLHLGMHIPMMTARFQWRDITKVILSCLFSVMGGIGLHLFFQYRWTDYLFFRVPFAFLDYDKPGILVFLETMMMLSFWALIGTQLAHICRNISPKGAAKQNPLLPLILIMAAVIIGMMLSLLHPSEKVTISFENADWTPVQEQEPLSDPEFSEKAVEDGFVLIQGGSFQMGSPESENWRGDDETRHEVTVASFFIDPYETTQEEYFRLMGENPSMFSGEKLPVECISWLDAVQFANAKSIHAGLTPAYAVSNQGVTWDRSANGYRLPTEAEWEYACRAGTETPFHTEHSLSAAEANFYGHYPYEIEENYFNNSVLEAKPGEYRQTTVPVGSFAPSAWGLYDMHGNVNEWVWDYYGAYEKNASNNPTGASSGTRHVYRGGGWNDFAKNMRSAYRAAGQENLQSFNLGVRLVRNAGNGLSGFVTAGETPLPVSSDGKILIAYFSWGGNTRGIAQEIHKQTGADLFEISPVTPYSDDYNTVLMQAQEDQHNQARPELSAHVQNMAAYDVILLGYPNWWASIPMPIASFLEEYDFTGKTIIPFCSHGGGRFGQSLTAIAKLAPSSVIGEGLSVHYSGGSSLSSDVEAWLHLNNIRQ